MKYPKTQIKNSGFILITVLLTVILLTAVLLDFNYASRENLHSADKFHSRFQSLNCARAGLNIILANLAQNPDPLANPNLRLWLENSVKINIEPGSCTITMYEENGKLNVNTLINKNGSFNRTRIDQFLRLIDLLNQQNPKNEPISYDLAPAIIDWIDIDDTITTLPFVGQENTGAESYYYQNNNAPAVCSNKYLDTLKELLLIKGMTRDIFYGDINSAASHKLPNGLAHYLTVYGDGKIDMNFAPELVLRSISENMNPNLVQNIIKYRHQQLFSNLSELTNLPGVEDLPRQSLIDTVTVKPNHYCLTITSIGSYRQINSTITAVVKINSATSKPEILYYTEGQ